MARLLFNAHTQEEWSGSVALSCSHVACCGFSTPRFSSAKGKPADYFARAKVAVGNARKDWKELMDYLGM